MTSYGIDLNEIEECVRYKRYPPRMNGNKREAKIIFAELADISLNGQMMYNEKRLVIQSKEQELDIVHGVHKGMGTTKEHKLWHPTEADTRCFFIRTQLIRTQGLATHKI